MNDASKQNKDKILLVDDDIEIRNMYAEILSMAGFETEEADDGVQGLEMAKKGKPAIVFTGINMPNMDGFTLMEKLKENSETAKIPVVISSHMGREEHRMKSEKMGAKDFIVKNRITPRETIERMNAILSKGKKFRISFDIEALDAPALLSSVGVEVSPNCPECGGQIILELFISDFEEENLEGKLICAGCGWKLS